MPVYKLGQNLHFPHPSNATPEGLLAVGGDLQPERLLLAYSMGIFPWFDPGMPLLWWSPDPRMIMHPREVYISKSMRKIIRDKVFEISFDTAFAEVIHACAATIRKNVQGTWLSENLIRAFLQLHQMGFAHSVEAWKDGQLAGGLYGLAIGSYFSGESMFYRVSNASKAAFIALAQFLDKHNFTIIDAQLQSKHLTSLGARPQPRAVFLDLLAEAIRKPTLAGKWNSPVQFYLELKHLYTYY